MMTTITEEEIYILSSNTGLVQNSSDKNNTGNDDNEVILMVVVYSVEKAPGETVAPVQASTGQQTSTRGLPMARAVLDPGAIPATPIPGASEKTPVSTSVVSLKPCYLSPVFLNAVSHWPSWSSSLCYEGTHICCGSQSFFHRCYRWTITARMWRIASFNHSCLSGHGIM